MNYFRKLSLLSSNMLGCPGDPLLHAYVSGIADLTKHLDSVKKVVGNQNHALKVIGVPYEGMHCHNVPKFF
jgi:hypothetical protein